MNNLQKRCEKCNQKFTANSKSQRFCSKLCSCRFVALNRKKRTPSFEQSVKFFWDNVVRGRGCWGWKGKRWGAGYGRIWVEGKSCYLHRFSYQLHFGEVPGNLYVCHTCDNPSCSNPNHLFLGTAQDNIDDMWRKGRANPPSGPRGTPAIALENPLYIAGENNGNHKLTDDDVRYIRRHYKRVSYKKSNSKELAAKFGVTINCILHAVKGKRWTHVK